MSSPQSQFHQPTISSNPWWRAHKALPNQCCFCSSQGAWTASTGGREGDSRAQKSCSLRWFLLVHPSPQLDGNCSFTSSLKGKYFNHRTTTRVGWARTEWKAPQTGRKCLFQLLTCSHCPSSSLILQIPSYCLTRPAANVPRLWLGTPEAPAYLNQPLNQPTLAAFSGFGDKHLPCSITNACHLPFGEDGAMGEDSKISKSAPGFAHHWTGRCSVQHEPRQPSALAASCVCPAADGLQVKASVSHQQPLRSPAPPPPVQRASISSLLLPGELLLGEFAEPTSWKPTDRADALSYHVLWPYEWIPQKGAYLCRKKCVYK